MFETISRQETKWGRIDWIYLSEGQDARRNFNVGIVTINAGAHEERHVHYGHEQMLYTLAGNGIHYINGERKDFGPGDLFVMESETIHEEVNTGDVPVKELLVSSPVVFGRAVDRSAAYVSYETTYKGRVGPEEAVYLYKAVERLSDDIKTNTAMPFTVFDIYDRAVLQTKFFPGACIAYCDPKNHPELCECFLKKVGPDDFTDGICQYICSHGITTYISPIIFDGRLIGIIRGGCFYSSEAGANEVVDAYYDTPKSAQESMRRIMMRIVGTIEDYCEYLKSVKEFEKKNEDLASEMEHSEALQRDLVNVEGKVTNLKINHHFLFNTLNLMAGMALDGDRKVLYQSIIDLSKMFRYTMADDLRMVPLRDEIEYLRTYLKLQKLRFGERLEVTYDLDDQCMGTVCPFNFLQPVAENAFTHGFRGFDGEMRIRITVRNVGNRYIHIAVTNNGIMPSKAEINRASAGLSGHSGHGLSLIYDKLDAAFAGSAEMELEAENGSFTVTVSMPKTGGAPERRAE
ncbi:MAG: histidine kinase [Anaerovoracaceae bacterium]|jgi:quercetin dioxygenase-like cupin family protein/ligand-binding sensor protein